MHRVGAHATLDCFTIHYHSPLSPSPPLPSQDMERVCCVPALTTPTVKLITSTPTLHHSPLIPLSPPFQDTERASAFERARAYNVRLGLTEDGNERDEDGDGVVEEEGVGERGEEDPAKLCHTEVGGGGGMRGCAWGGMRGMREVRGGVRGNRKGEGMRERRVGVAGC